ncbi:MAG: Asp-tRNA(Asn)/Glu-tRNA(Gln) amidotransferase subunit GatB [Ignavibacteriales bacterium]|nr:Asp-tRNA(Asn)/Glu-tRNA(Gln) amidotransferase subunit GatB [Ignavibacteriales bacterium]
MKYEPVIGLEVHAQLLTDTKIFCGCSARFGTEPNTNCCPVCLGHPGVLPVLNKKVVEFAIRMGYAVHCTINNNSVIARKNYFYPDLPKGYQISQYELPICSNGYIDIHLKDKEPKRIRINRIHIEEDAGKSVHGVDECTGIDVNRCGVPLIEIVTEPDMSSGEEAAAYLAKIKQIVQYLEICDGNMEEGSLRCDANISIRPVSATYLGTKTEVKNMNSFKNVEKAVAYEIQRQKEVLEDGGQITQQTLLWDADKQEAFSMRSKEEAHDYRYFPEPDLMPIALAESWLKEIEDNMTELPEARRNRFAIQYNLPEYDAEVLTQEKNVADYFEAACTFAADYKGVSNWVMGEVLRVLNEKKTSIGNFAITPGALGELVNLTAAGTVSSKIAKEVFGYMLAEGKPAKQIVEERQLVQISDESAIRKIVEQIVVKFPEEFNQLKDGKEKVFGFFVGQIMRETKGKANPQLVNELLRKIAVE